MNNYQHLDDGNLGPITAISEIGEEPDLNQAIQGRQQQLALESCRTASEVAALLFPQVAEYATAFYEREVTIGEIPYVEVAGLSEDFWAWTLSILASKHPIIFCPNESKFRRFAEKTGIYEPISESVVAGQVINNIDHCAWFLPKRIRSESLYRLKDRQTIKTVVQRAKELLAVDEDYFRDHAPYQLSVMNGIIQVDNKTFKESNPAYPVRESLPVRYDPDAKCELFLKSFLGQILEPDDIDLLQRYCSQVLEGINHTQTILVLTGDAGWGKSSLMKILGGLVGWRNVGVIRENLFKDEYELSHYSGKHFLFHPDMPTEFLNRPEATLFKQLVGNDPLWANVKSDEGRIVIHGTFPTILACNGKPKIHLDEDRDAWERRLVVLSFKKPAHETHFGKMAELIQKQELPGILNWLLEGRAKLWKDKLQLVQTKQQEQRVTNLLMASESPTTFVRTKVVKRPDAVMTIADLYGHYQQWCRVNQLAPFPSKEFTRMAKNEIEIRTGLKCRHDLFGIDGLGAKRGWIGVGIKSTNVSEY